MYASWCVGAARSTRNNPGIQVAKTEGEHKTKVADGKSADKFPKIRHPKLKVRHKSALQNLGIKNSCSQTRNVKLRLASQVSKSAPFHACTGEVILTMKQPKQERYSCGPFVQEELPSQL